MPPRLVEPSRRRLVLAVAPDVPREVWWGLPGPRRLLERVHDDLDDGSSVVLALPRSLAGGWERRLRVVRTAWRPLVIVGAARPAADVPLALLTERLAEFVGEAPARDAGALAGSMAVALEKLTREDGLAGPIHLLIELDGTSPSWPAWMRLLSDWADASRNLPVAQRTALLAIVTGCPLRGLPSGAGALRVHACRAVADETDLLLYASDAFRAASLPSLQRRVAAAVAARVAVWEPDVVDALAAEPLSRVLEPEAALADLARERGWDEEAVRAAREWAEGQEDAFGSVSSVSAARARAAR
jgi:hypothetical protein